MEAGVPWGIFISVSISILSFVIAIGIVALTNKTDIKNLEKRGIEDRASLEALRIEIEADVEKIKQDKLQDILQFADALAKFNSVLTKFEVSIEGFRVTMIHAEKTLEAIDKRLEQQNGRIAKLELKNDK